MDEVSPWKQRLYFVTGGMPDGMYLLCFYHRWVRAFASSFRNVRSDLCNHSAYRGAGLNVVVMGTGEPLDNYENLLKFLRLLTDENGLHISQRNVTVSTCGLVPEMRKLADEKLQITLALSLHASNDEKRKKLMPIAKRYSIGEIMEACAYYFEKSGQADHL